MKTAPSRLASLLGLACTSLMAAATVRAAAPSPTQPAAAWMPHDVLVEYRNLPRAYSCDELWHKVCDMLRTPTDGRSPKLQVRFLTLRALDPQETRWAEAEATAETVVELLEQTQEDLLSTVSNLHAVGAGLRCEESVAKPYRLSPQALVATQAR